MTIDPDEQPTRFGGSPPPAPPGKRPDDPTIPAFDAKKKGAPAARNDNKPAARPVPVSNDPLIGKELGGCRLERLLGRGAMGAVYQARQLKLDRDVAVKIIRPEMMTDERMLKRFEVEARTVGKFNSANVVMVHDVGFELGMHWLVMEFVQGKNLRDHVKLLAGGRLPAGEALPLLRQSIKGLEEAQRLEVVHRDIKPDNLMLTDRGVLKIADFGIAKPLQEDFSMTLTSELVGTPLYMSPEQCQGEAQLDFRSDMYSLGATFYYLLTGEPPIRASSVYELIQTKTKLANLCLWKALPGLEENNPLSRVIERMTALDREDRYGSYEELLNDLVLVEQGQTITVPKRTGGTGIRKRLAAKGGNRRNALLAAAALLLAGGGGYAWYATRPAAVVPGPAASEAGVAADARLTQMRASLQENGPSDTLQKEAQTLQVTGSQVKERTKLVEDIGVGLTLKKELAGITPPAELALPFDDLARHFDAVKAAAPLTQPVPAELTKWRLNEIDKVRNERELSAKAISTLSGAFTQWTLDRGTAGADLTKKAALRDRLKAIADARTKLATLVPACVPDLDKALSQDQLGEALVALDRTDDTPDNSDDSGTLAEARTEFVANGPLSSVRKRVDDLRPRKQDQIDARAQLLNEIQVAERALGNASQIRDADFPANPKAPFDDVAEFYRGLDRAFSGLRDAENKLPPWADKKRTEFRAEGSLSTAVLETCRSAFAAWQTRQQAGAPSAELATGLKEVKAAFAGAVAVFPSLAAELDKAIPKTTLATAETNIERAEQREKWSLSATSWEKRLTALAKLVDWQRDGGALGRELETLRKAAAPFGADAEAVQMLRRADEATANWNSALAKVTAAGKQLAAGDLTAASQSVGAGVAGPEGQAELTAIGDAITACSDAFKSIENKLDVADARTKLASATTRIQPLATLLPGAAERLARWTAAIEKFETTAGGMVVIPAGRPKGGARLPAFFMSPTECSRAEFAQFLTELRAAAGNGDPTQKLAAVAPRLAGTNITAERLQGLLALDVKVDKQPIERVSFHSASAYAAWTGRALPTPEEWLLAALGDEGRVTYAFGNEWTNDSQQRNLSETNAVEVDSGGLSWRKADGLRIHHLAGNVAEWLAADPAAREAKIAGGRYLDKIASAKEQAAGKMPSYDKTDAQRGFGFRTVLRPRSFRELDWPR